MIDDQKFGDVKQQMLDENSRQYGDEVKQKWGQAAWDESQQQFKNLSQAQLEQAQGLYKQFQATLKQTYEVGDPGSALAQQAVELHKQWC